MKIVIVEFVGEYDDVHAVYINGELHKHGDYHHDKIKIWIKAFIEGIKYTGIDIEEETITCNNAAISEDICENNTTPPVHLNDLKIK